MEAQGKQEEIYAHCYYKWSKFESARQTRAKYLRHSLDGASASGYSTHVPRGVL